MKAWCTIFLELAIPNGSKEFLLAYVGWGSGHVCRGAATDQLQWLYFYRARANHTSV